MPPVLRHAIISQPRTWGKVRKAVKGPNEPLPQPLNDLGFSLTGGSAQLNLTKPALDDAVQEFGRQVQGADVALFYYAGHGVQVRGSNFLVPVNANPTREADARQVSGMS